jgi:hypothetical protein
VPEPAPNLDVRSFEQLRDALLASIPVHAPEWTDHDVSDPGVTLLELFAFLATTSPLGKRDVAMPRPETVRAVRERLEGRWSTSRPKRRGLDPLLARIDAVSPSRES